MEKLGLKKWQIALIIAILVILVAGIIWLFCNYAVFGFIAAVCFVSFFGEALG